MSKICLLFSQETSECPIEKKKKEKITTFTEHLRGKEMCHKRKVAKSSPRRPLSQKKPPFLSERWLKNPYTHILLTSSRHFWLRCNLWKGDNWSESIHPLAELAHYLSLHVEIQKKSVIQKGQKYLQWSGILLQYKKQPLFFPLLPPCSYDYNHLCKNRTNHLGKCQQIWVSSSQNTGL